MVVKRGTGAGRSSAVLLWTVSCCYLLSTLCYLSSAVFWERGDLYSINTKVRLIDCSLWSPFLSVACISVRISQARLNCADRRRPPDHTTLPDRWRRVQFPTDGMK